jgi:GNAT superfamily N-acetyltransferase
MIRKASKYDIPDLVDIHMAALPNDLLPKIGKDFLRKYFYTVVLESNHAFTIVDAEGETVRSFIIFAYNSKALTGQVMHNKAILAKHFFLCLLRDFSLIGQIFAHLRGFKAEIYSELDFKIKEIPELYLMATAPKHHSKGIGSRLISRGLEILSEKHQYCMVKTPSRRAKKFYMKHHFHEIGLEYRQGRKFQLLLYRLHAK